MSTSNTRSPIKTDTSIPRRPLLWMAAALVFTLPPFFDSLAIWIPWLFLLSLALKFWMEPRGYRLRSVVLKLLFVATAFTTVFVSYGSVRGVEAAISLLVVLLFLLFPRINAGLQFELRPFRTANTGFSDRLSPGRIAALANSSEIAFRAEFPGSSTRPSGPMYWRGIVMWHCNGMEWRAPDDPRPKSPSTTRDITGTGGLPVQSPNAKEIQQRITLAPHGARWMFALDHPIKTPPAAMLARGDYLSSVLPIRKSRQSEVVSSDSSGDEITSEQRAEALEVPASISPAVRDLAHSWTVQNPEPRGIVNSALQFFRTQGFSYSLTPGEYNDLEEFLFRRRVGFCEHYATSFATLMRLAGIPARVVVGYLGGEYNDLGHFFLV